MVRVVLLGLAIALLVAAWWWARRARAPGRALPPDAVDVEDVADAGAGDTAPDRQSPIPAAPARDSWRPIRTARPRRHPVVVAHGVLGFGSLGIGSLRQDYFRGVAARLRAAGVDVRATRVAPLAGVEERARQLAAQIRALDAERVNVIAHSMGGLDARVAISEMGIADRVAALVTVGTPHHGTPLADGSAQLIAALRRLGVDLAALDDLRTDRMQALNRRVPDARGVAYFSYVGTSSPASANVLLRPSLGFLLRRAGPNDGLVPGASQRWGTVLGEIDADHWAQIGWGPRFDAVRFYESVVLRLRGLGL